MANGNKYEDDDDLQEWVTDIPNDPQELEDEFVRTSTALAEANQTLEELGYEPVSPADIELGDDDGEEQRPAANRARATR